MPGDCHSQDPKHSSKARAVKVLGSRPMGQYHGHGDDLSLVISRAIETLKKLCQVSWIASVLAMVISYNWLFQ